MYQTEKLNERVILVSIDDGSGRIDENMNELSLLADTGGAEVMGIMTQGMERPHPGHYLGKGKLEELKDYITLKDATGIICDDELSNTQIKGMESVLGVKIMDRAMLILDIFAKRANTAEGKTQVELAQQRYNLSHLAGIGTALSRLGGGIGTRGPGEKKLETDRRHIRNRIAELNRELDDIEKSREVLRGRREKNGIPIVALVGYTNAGKSTLMNAITDAGVYVEDKLFATLDTTTRKLTLENSGTDILLSDTVGFIRKLPHHLIQAFRSTLEELKYADILLHVVDISSDAAASQMDTVHETLGTLGVMGKPLITVYNKSDLHPDGFPSPLTDKSIRISALTGQGLDSLTKAIEDVLQTFAKRTAVLIPYSDGHILAHIHGHCDILLTEHRENGTYMELYAKPDSYGRLLKYTV